MYFRIVYVLYEHYDKQDLYICLDILHTIPLTYSYITVMRK